MTTALKEAIEKEVVELTVKERELFIKLEAVQDEIKPHVQRMESARSEWCSVYNRMNSLTQLLPKA